MAVKQALQDIKEDTILFSSSDTTAEAGGILSYVGTTASGAAEDSSLATLGYVAEPSGIKPAALLMWAIVNEDLTDKHENRLRLQTQTGSKLYGAKRGMVVTDYVLPGVTPAPGDIAYVAHSGYISNADEATDHVDATGATRRIGRFETAKDEDGYVRLALDVL